MYQPVKYSPLATIDLNFLLLTPHSFIWPLEFWYSSHFPPLNSSHTFLLLPFSRKPEFHFLSKPAPIRAHQGHFLAPSHLPWTPHPKFVFFFSFPSHRKVPLYLIQRVFYCLCDCEEWLITHYKICHWSLNESNVTSKREVLFFQLMNMHSLIDPLRFTLKPIL